MLARIRLPAELPCHKYNMQLVSYLFCLADIVKHPSLLKQLYEIGPAYKWTGFVVFVSNNPPLPKRTANINILQPGRYCTTIMEIFRITFNMIVNKFPLVHGKKQISPGNFLQNLVNSAALQPINKLVGFFFLLKMYGPRTNYKAKT